MDPKPATEKQHEYVEGLRKRLRLAPALLDNHCIATYGAPLASLDRGQVSRLLDEMVAWESTPGELMRAAGQQDLPGL